MELCFGASSCELQTHALSCHGNIFHGSELKAGWQGVGEVGLREIGIIYFDDGPDVFL